MKYSYIPGTGHQDFQVSGRGDEFWDSRGLKLIGGF